MTVTAADTLAAGAESIKDEVLDVGTEVLPFAAVLVAFGIGWRLVRRLVKP